MNIELKNFKHNARLSEETVCFTADLFVNGKHAAECLNRGQGGPTDYYAKDRLLLQEAEQWALSLPAEKVEMGGSVMFIPMNLENYIDNLVEAKLKEKDRLRMERLYKNKLVWGKPNATALTTVKLSHPIAEMLAIDVGREILKRTVDKFKKQLKPGEVFWNTNLPKEWL